MIFEYIKNTLILIISFEILYSAICYKLPYIPEFCFQETKYFKFKRKLIKKNKIKECSFRKKSLSERHKIRLRKIKLFIEEKFDIMEKVKLSHEKEIEFESILRQVFSIWCRSQNITMRESMRLFYEDRKVLKKKIEDDMALLDTCLNDWFLLNTESGQHISYLVSTCPKNIDSYSLNTIYDITFLDFLKNTSKK